MNRRLVVFVLFVILLACSSTRPLGKPNDMDDDEYVVAPRSASTTAVKPDDHSCDDDIGGCAKKVRTHEPDRDGCMPVECKAGTKSAYFLFVKDEKAKAKALALERDSWP